jgi:N-methylhydantoinase A/oxoprolinase/acetone carboxylase beta subunit
MICIDMGGTSFEVSLVVGGKESVVLETNFEGFPIRAPMVDIHSIGAGGGSIAWSESGALRVGPRSAGAEPGPACYGKGGSVPTVTDANVVLGRIDPESFLGGRMKLDEAAARVRGRRVRRNSSTSAWKRWRRDTRRHQFENGQRHSHHDHQQGHRSRASSR